MAKLSDTLAILNCKTLQQSVKAKEAKLVLNQNQKYFSNKQPKIRNGPDKV